MGVKALFRHAARLWPDRLFLDDARERLSYGDAAERVGRMACGLGRGESLAGTKIALLTPNSSAGFCALLAIYEADAVFVPLNASFPIGEHRAAIEELGVSILLFSRTLATGVDALLRDCPTLREAICIDGDAGIGTPLDALLARGAGRTMPDIAGDPDDIVAIYPTGGSTGRPKRVMHSRRNWTTMAACFHSALPVEGHARYLAAPPITHAAGAFGLMLMAKGATILLHDGFDAGAILDAIERDRPTHLYLPPTAIYKLLEHPGVQDRDGSSLRAFMYTAAPMSLDKLRRCIAIFGPVMAQFWGQMEAPSFCTCLAPADHVVDDEALAGRLASCGRETMFTRVEVLDDDGAILPPGERGELAVRGGLVMAGYYENPEATAEVSRNGWHLTGDLGFKDADGYVHIVGRKRDIIITGGYNVYPADVEQALWGHPDVEECAVIGVPDELWGEAVLAVVQPRPGHDPSAAELIAWCKEKVGSIKAPKRVELRTDIPRNAVGKVDKVTLRAPYWKDRARAV
ncbi:AMP-dependent synthetase and ligase [Rhizorhabdus wittichii RW1]|uniref:3-methylmercaptopropionyl-CoA ligase n=1 Tax=Rhizorhabdus wittichii (strain DSM 6014 / CCUG 31198 / JCM 15750 / NBRC 105917 / EY 4224 / RW1) TaxID=392499 RepID=A0A9J9HAM4_RHIWR|nr:AMP-dependent synthetase and ligase [Rhizorhabdus wittichii RW1]